MPRPDGVGETEEAMGLAPENLPYAMAPMRNFTRLLILWLTLLWAQAPLPGAPAASATGAAQASLDRSAGGLRVLVIGIGAYAHLPRLAFAASDARDLARALRDQGGAGKLYREARTRVLTDDAATLPAIRAALEWLTTDVPPGETLILALFGHAVKEGKAVSFAPVDLEPENMARAGLPWEEVLGRLEAVRPQARAVWVLADCGRTARELARERQATGRELRHAVDEGGNLIVVAASEGNRPSYESDALKHGLFTQARLEALRGEAPAFLYEETPRGRVLTLSGLQFIVSARVKQLARQEVEFPRLEGSFSPSQPIFMPVAARSPLDLPSGGGRILEK